eukprot:gb/GEZN01010441.1/.p1 GENE.gb/GEZN01010441.1/~~gb/GEZN01010441.1/.p1  ORF type:complete len:254 (+),score=54.93 gb/GEZN01010441.1/:93-854(+)
MFEFERERNSDSSDEEKKSSNKSPKRGTRNRALASSPARRRQKTTSKTTTGSSSARDVKENENPQKKSSRKTASSKKQVTIAPTLRRPNSRSILVTPSPLKSLAVSPIQDSEIRSLHNAFRSPSAQRSVSIFTPAENPISKPLKEAVDFVAMMKIGELNPHVSPPRDVVVDKVRYGQRTGSPESESSEDLLDLWNPAVQQPFKAAKAKAKKKTTKEVAKQKELEKRQQQHLYTTKDFYDRIDAAALEEFFEIE